MRFVIFLLFMAAAIPSSSQDTILQVSGEELVTVILTMSEEDVRYKKYGFEEGPTYILPLSKVFLIKMENGVKYVYREHLTDSLLYYGSLTTTELYRQGRLDAVKYYDDKFVNIGISALGTSAIPIIFIPALIIKSMSDPKIKREEFPNQEMAKTAAYRKGYIKKTKELRNHHFFAGAGVTILLKIIFYGILLNMSTW